MLSKLQINLLKLKRKLQVGDKLIYSDMSNYMEFEVVELKENLFVTKDLETNELEERNIFSLQHGWDFENSYFKELCLLSNNYKESQNKEAYKNDMQKYVEIIKPLFDFEDSNFNTQGGIGWELRKDKECINIYMWFYDPSKDEEILPEEYEIGKKYEIGIQIEFYKDENDFKTFENFEEALEFLKTINE